MKHLPKALIIASFIFSGGILMAIEEPPYERISEEGTFQVRRYPKVLIAEVFVDGDMDQASRLGFRLIADFIFGNNTRPSSDAQDPEKIAMTAPVTMEPVAQKIEMTAPVTMEPVQVPPEQMTTAKRWRVQFVMPSSYTLTSLPKPKNSSVFIREVPGATYAVLTYSGFNFLSSVQAQTDALMDWVEGKKMVAIQPPQLARYNPPWTLPMWRRNEIMVQIKPGV